MELGFTRIERKSEFYFFDLTHFAAKSAQNPPIGYDLS